MLDRLLPLLGRLQTISFLQNGGKFLALRRRFLIGCGRCLGQGDRAVGEEKRDQKETNRMDFEGP
jgi:hypothetical protein